MMSFRDGGGLAGSRLSDILQVGECYGCPVCRYGQLEALFMVEALNCTFCHHIFTIDATQRYLRLEDNAQRLQWQRWNGRWLSARTRLSSDWMLVVWGLALTFVLLPTFLVGLVYYTFPPLPGQASSLFPLVWVGFTFLAHGIIAVWLLFEHYQFPLYMIVRLYLWRVFNPLVRE
jgi:hypothetical protein